MCETPRETLMIFQEGERRVDAFCTGFSCCTGEDPATPLRTGARTPKSVGEVTGSRESTRSEVAATSGQQCLGVSVQQAYRERVAVEWNRRWILRDGHTVVGGTAPACVRCTECLTRTSPSRLRSWPIFPIAFTFL